MIKKQALSFFFSLALSGSLVCATNATTDQNKKISTSMRIAKNMAYGAAHGTLAACSGAFCLGAIFVLNQTSGRGGRNGGLSYNFDELFAFAAIAGGIPSTYGLCVGLKGVYAALKDSYCALTETGDNQVEEKAKPEIIAQAS